MHQAPHLSQKLCKKNAAARSHCLTVLLRQNVQKERRIEKCFAIYVCRRGSTPLVSAAAGNDGPESLPQELGSALFHSCSCLLPSPALLQPPSAAGRRRPSQAGGAGSPPGRGHRWLLQYPLWPQTQSLRLWGILRCSHRSPTRYPSHLMIYVCR